MDFKLHLVIENMENLQVDNHDCNMIAKVEWRGSERKSGFLARRIEINYTCKQKVKANGTVSWNEGFDHTCKFMRQRSGIYKSWIIVIQIEEVQEKMKIIGKVKVDVAEFIQLENNDKSIRIPINCSFGGHIAQAMLMVKLQLIKIEPKSCGKTKSFKLSHNQSINLPKTDPTSHDSESKVQNKKLTEPNLFILNETSDCYDSKKLTETCIHEPSSKAIRQKQRSFASLLCLSTKKVGQNDPLLLAKKEDDIDDDSHYQPCVQFITAFKKVKVRPEENFKTSGFERNHKFEIGQWMRKKLVSRDHKIELVTDVFLASIDQRSERASGGSACTVLAAVIADWLHKNPKSLPSQCQFDELVLKGSLEWRNLCAEGNHNAKFSDKHFDLDTVLEAKIKSLAVATEKSYVGFFSMDEMPEGFEWLQGEMCFDNIWNNILCNEVTDERMYITSWNDHFFVLKVESNAIYLLDTLGERLSEGCNQAYILKFDAESVILRHGKDGKESKNPQDLVSEGMECCKEYIKGFLSTIPLREVQKDIKRGQAKQELLNRLLQIDFHYTVPSTRKNC